MTTTANAALAARFAQIAATADRDRRRGVRPAHDRELAGYAAQMRDVSVRLGRHGCTPAQVTEMLSLFAYRAAAELATMGFDSLRDRDDATRRGVWAVHGRLNACRTALEILAG